VAPLDAVGTTLLDLVAHRIGEILRRVSAVHAVAVRVDQAVKVAQAEQAVAAQDREGHGAKPAAGDHGGVRFERGQLGVVGARRTAAVPALESRPELIVDVIDLGDKRVAAGGPLDRLTIDLVELLAKVALAS
jgi:hypothetical protein